LSRNRTAAAFSNRSWSKLIDFAAALPFIGWLSWICGQIAVELIVEIESFFQHPQWPLGLRIINQSMAVVFFIAQIVFFAVRPAAKQKSRGLMPRFAAIFTMCAGLLYYYAPATNLNPFVQSLAVLFGVAGLSLAIFALLWLGRSFSILPEARKLVTRGPYSVVRHPLYAAEALSTIGITLQLTQPIGILIAAAIFLGQFARMGFEEEVLARSFPEYADYQKKTFRVIPYIY
jgi:protein-S-isoprenylcysteine O-methyltransferase Ste14